MRALFIGKIWPEPASSAAGRRTMEMLEAMQSYGWDVVFATAAQHSDFSLDLSGTGIETKQVALNDSGFDDWVVALQPNLVVFDRFMTEEQFGWRIEKACPDALRVLDTSDLHCLRDARHKCLKTGEPLDLFNEAALREIASIYRSDLTLMISEFEMQVLQSEFSISSELVGYCPFFAEPVLMSSAGFSERKDFMMIGSFMHEPNWDAVRWCCSEIWPLIREKLPTAELHIYGSYAGEKVFSVADRKKGIVVKGRAENVLDTMNQYRVNLAPLRFGAGLKGKLMDAFVAGLPSVVTPVASEAMNGEIPWGCFIHSEASGFASTAVEVYQKEDLWTRVRDCGRNISEQRFAKKAWVESLEDKLEAAMEKRNENRRRNFIGSLLRHHHHRSTEFMSRWIEAKNSKTSD